MESTLKYIQLYTGCDNHALNRIKPLLEKLVTEKIIVVKEKEIVEVYIQKAKPKGTIKKWAEQYFINNNTSYLEVSKLSRKTEVLKIRNAFCIAAYKEGYGYSEIGRYLKRDHTTILHIINKLKTI